MTTSGIVSEITDAYGVKGETFVYVRLPDGSTTGGHISKCFGFIPKVGQNVIIDNDNETGEWCIKKDDGV